ncbi:MAG: MotA/TolQ/ExbB proton channel family protein [Hyphomicrobium sp.]
MEPARDFSIISLVMHADPVVKAVMAGLVLASVACWGLIFEKSVRMWRLRRDVRAIEDAARIGSFPDSGNGVVGALQAAAQVEATEGAAPGEDGNDIRGRLERAMRGAMKRELQRIEAGLPFLATVGSSAPFVGLFGTVWGIMNSFTSIAQQKDTSLAVVAPGIAEALFATALGLVAAIPAVIAYNHFAVKLGRASEQMGAAIALIAKRLARRHDAAHENAGPDKAGAVPLRRTV